MDDKETILSGVKSALNNISDYALKTPLLKATWLSIETGANIYLKMESEQITGSFKLRGSTNKILNICKSEKPEKIVVASTGNHALASAYVTSALGIKLKIFGATNLAKVKEEKLSAYSNIELVKRGSDVIEAHIHARKYAKDHGYPFASSYNDVDILYGQATIGKELLEQLPALNAVIIPVGGGGLAAGIAMYLKAVKPAIKIIGCQPAINAFFYDSIKAGKVLEEYVHKDSFGVVGPIERDCITFPLCQKLIDDWVLPSESDIKRAVYDMLVQENKLIEGGAGQVIAGARMLGESYKNKNVALIICGANIGVENTKDIIDSHIHG